MFPRKSVLNLTIAICFIYSINGGTRGNYGILLEPLSQSSGTSYADVSFILAISQLLFGVLQPLFGVIALKVSERFVLMLGLICIALGFLLTPFCNGFWSLLISFGILVGTGAAAVSFGLLLAIVSPQIPKNKSSVVSGYLNASSGVGTTVLAPVLTAISHAFGILGCMLFLGLPTLLMLPVGIWLCKRLRSNNEPTIVKDHNQVNVKAMLKDALTDRSYIFLLIGFFTCGFHMSILETHLFSQMTTFGFDRQIASYLFMLYGILTMIGSALSGYLCNIIPMRILLGTLYAMRVVLAIAILIMPMQMWYLIPFVIFLGLCSDSTVSPTAGIILNNFGATKLATLFGLTFVTHQIGAFISAWLGGMIVQYLHSYDVLWIGDAILSSVAALVSYIVIVKK